MVMMKSKFLHHGLWGIVKKMCENTYSGTAESMESKLHSLAPRTSATVGTAFEQQPSSAKHRVMKCDT